MWFEDDIFRVAYLPWILIPLLLSVIGNNLTIFSIIPEIIGWCILGIGGNLFNDYVDMDRKLKVGRISLLVMSVSCILFGTIILINYIFYLIILFIISLLYTFKLKGIFFIDIILFAVAFPIPYLSLVETIDFNILVIFEFFAVFALIVDKLSDEKKYKNKIKECNIFIILFGIMSFMLTSFIILKNNFYSFLVPIPVLSILAISFLIKKFPLKLTLSYKIVGTYIWVFFTFYLMAILAQMGKLI